MNTKFFCQFGVVICVLALMIKPAHSQVRIERPGSASWIYHLTVDPAAEMQPALTYRIMRGAHERKPGNAATAYYRAITLFTGGPGKDLAEIYDAFQTLENSGKNLSEFPREQVRKYLQRCTAVLDEIEIASTREHCDWGIRVQELDGVQTMNLRLAEFQECRNLARLLMLKARLAIVDHDYDEAIHSIQMGCQMGRDVAQCPTVITGLIGAAIFHVMLVPLQEIIAEPASPNLYWAVASAPRPFIDLRPALEQEFNWVFKFALIHEAEQPHTPAEWRRLFSESFQVVQQLYPDSSFRLPYFSPPDGSKLNPQVAAVLLAMREYPRAKAELTRLGLTSEQIEPLPVIQVIALHEAKLVKYQRDEFLKWAYLPYHQAAPFIQRLDLPTDEERSADRLVNLEEALPMFRGLRPGMSQVLLAGLRVDRRLVRVQVIEALRMHAAANDRKFPAALSEIKVIPVPNDPFSGLPIVYRLEGETAVLEFPYPSIPPYGEVIRLSLRKIK
ncbi:MAG: hypothetical protein JWM11_6978 [Planctomycetaceae bacterium]|nr:hypothetical protein [Planctomycetaceae bacterium]